MEHKNLAMIVYIKLFIKMHIFGKTMNNICSNFIYGAFLKDQNIYLYREFEKIIFISILILVKKISKMLL